jgi:hypothetical protein
MNNLYKDLKNKLEETQSLVDELESRIDCIEEFVIEQMEYNRHLRNLVLKHNEDLNMIEANEIAKEVELTPFKCGILDLSGEIGEKE